MTSSRRRIAGLILGLSVALSLSGPKVMGAPKTRPTGSSQSQTAAERIQAYAELHRRLDQEAPPLHGHMEPDAIAAHRAALARLLVAARPDARPGDLLVPGLEASLREAARRHFAGAVGQRLKDRLAEEGSLEVAVTLHAAVPPEAGAERVPFELLGLLPELPDELEYRLVGRHLILRDTEADLVVDFIANLLP